MYLAFEPISLLDKLPVKVESLSFYKDILYVGTQSGALLLYKILPTNDEEDKVAYTDEFGQKFKIELLKSIKTFSKKPIEQIDVVPGLGLLFALTDNQVNAYDLLTLQFQSSLVPNYFATQSKGYLRFVQFTGIEMLSNEGVNPIPNMTTRICILGKKSLIMMMWIDSEFATERTKEYTIPERIKSMEFLDATHLWLATSTKEYYQLDLNSEKYQEVKLNDKVELKEINNVIEEDKRALSPSPSIRTGVTSMITGIAYSSTQYVSSYNPLNSILSSQAIRPPMLRINEEEMVIVKEEIGLFVGDNLDLKRELKIHLPDEPHFLLYSYPYLIIVTNKQIEVRNLLSQATIQTYQLNNIPIAIKEGKAPFIATSNQIFRLVPSHFADQINKLIELKLFPEALTLLEQNKSRITEVKVQSEEEIKKLYALDLFFNGKYEEALNLFYELKSDLSEVLSLFPKAIYGTAKEFSVENKDKKNSPYQYSTDPEEWGYHRLHDSVENLAKFLTQYRNDRLKEESNADMALIDTTLIKCYLLINEAMVGPLLRIKNHVDILIIEEILKEKKKYKELIELYFNKGLHRNALLLLNENNKDDINDTLNYLKRISDFDLIMEFSQHCFKVNPSLALDLFLSEHENSHNYQAKQVLMFLKRESNELALIYCLNVLDKEYTHFKEPKNPNHLNIDDTQVHTDFSILLIEYLINKLKQIKESTKYEQDDETFNLELEAFIWENLNNLDWSKLDILKDIKEDTKALLDQFKEHLLYLFYFLLARPSYYKPEKVLGRLPNNLLFKPRALALYKLKRYDQGLNLIVERLKDYSGAIQYCLINKDSEIFFSLFKLYLKLNIKDQMLNLLNTYFKYLPLLDTINSLPSDTKVKEVEEFLVKNLETNLFLRHKSKVRLNLSKAYQHQLNFQQLKYKRKAISIDKDTICHHCLKRIGTSAFKLFPNGDLLHYNCG